MGGNTERSDETAELQKRPTRGRETMQKLAIILSVLVALVAANPATGAKPQKSAHVQASADFVWVDNCSFGGIVYTTTGHLEINAYDDDQTVGPYSWSPQNDRISMRIVWADGQVWEPDTIAVTINENEAKIAVGSWYTVFTAHDGGRRGTAPTGELYNGVPATADWATFRTPSLCGDGMYFLTSGEIKVTDDWTGAPHS